VSRPVAERSQVRLGTDRRDRMSPSRARAGHASRLAACNRNPAALCRIHGNLPGGLRSYGSMTARCEGLPAPSIVPQPDLSRRRFLSAAATTCGALGVGLATIPFIESWLPSERARAMGSPVEVDTSKVEAGQMIVAVWQRHPVFVLHRTEAQLQRLRQPSDTALLRDPDSEVLQQPPYAKNWHRSVKPDYLIVVGICTHLGCVPRYEPQSGGTLGPGWPGGYFCPCHGSRYDLSARVFRGVPAPYNLPVPPYRFLDDATVRIGENPPGTSFEFSSIVQM
jgi:ubiquinol-cytochrome c reductase iron-sulfur subunit